MMFNALIGGALSWLPSNRALAKAERRLQAWFDERDAMIERGFTLWTTIRPPQDATVWVRRSGEDEERLLVVADVHPMFNVADLWWKDAEDGEIIDVSPRLLTTSGNRSNQIT